MTTPEQKALALATDANGEVDEEKFEKEFKLQIAERNRRLRTAARASYRAIEGWWAVKTPEKWEETIQQAEADLVSGSFLINRLGAERHVDPLLTATLLALRNQLIDDHNAATAAEIMIIDSTVLCYYNQLRVNGWIGDLGQELEAEFFGRKTLSAEMKDRYGTADIRGLRVEDIVTQLTQKLAPVFEKMNRTLLRNLEALKTWRRPQTPNVSVERAGQVNVGQQQVNVAKNDDSDSLSD